MLDDEALSVLSLWNSLEIRNKVASLYSMKKLLKIFGFFLILLWIGIAVFGIWGVYR